jgi:AcrR family transcriptional regulator
MSSTGAAKVAGPKLGGDHRSRPRRRGSTLDAAILRATIAEIDQHGYADLSIERVAERARASKASVYRRWPSKVALVLAAVHNQLPDTAAAPDTGSLRGDLMALFLGAARQLSGPAGVAIRGMLGDALRDPELHAELRRYTRGRSGAALRDVLRLAGQRGELSPEAITPRQLEAGMSVLRFHFLVHGAPVADTVVVEIVDEVVLPLFHAVAGTESAASWS